MKKMQRPARSSLLLAAMATMLVEPSPAGPVLDAIMARSAAQAAEKADGDPGAAEMMGEHGANTKAVAPPGAAVQRDLAYGPDPAQRLDVYAPREVKAAPVVFMVHGGAWMLGDKGQARVVTNKASHWLSKGFLFVSIGYRMSRSPKVLDQVDDVALALAYVQANAARWGGDPKRVVVMGHSAGAHLVSMLTSAPEFGAAHGVKPWLATISLDSAVFDLPELMRNKHYPFYDHVFGSDPAFWAQASPQQRLVAAPLAPMMLVCSTKRSDSCPQAEAYARKARGLGGRIEVLPVDLTHADVNDRLGTSGEYTRRVDEFIRSTGLS